jgi:hypothetical protein
MATIQLTITATPVVTASGVRVQLELRNAGDAAARNVMPILAFRGNETLGTFEPLLDAGGRTSQTIVIPVESTAAVRGTWPLYFRVAYADANNHPFEAMHVMAVDFGSSATARPAVTVDVTGARFSVSGQANARVQSSVSTEASVSFAVPAGVAASPEHASVFLEPGTRTVAAVVTNAGATAPSRLPIFAVVEFNAGSEHTTAIGAGAIEITGDAPFPTWVLPAAMAGLIVVWLVLVGVRRRAPRSAP